MTEWRITQKPSFLNDLLRLPAKEERRILQKIAMLSQDPTPDAKVKKQLRHMGGKLHRLRSGDYRIFYTFEAPYISLLALRRRSEERVDAAALSRLRWTLLSTRPVSEISVKGAVVAGIQSIRINA